MTECCPDMSGDGQRRLRPPVDVAYLSKIGTSPSVEDEEWPTALITFVVQLLG